MKELTIRNKTSLVALLESHYTIKEKNFIDAIASNEEEKLNLTLMAYAIGAEPMNTPTNVPTDPLKYAVINKLCAKLQFVKAIKEVKNLSLKEAKDLANQLLINREETFGEFYSEPFIIGDSTDSKFTKTQWEEICRRSYGDMAWKYVLDMWKPGQLVTINHKVYRVTKVKTETAKSIPPTLICMCCDIKRGTNFCSENCGKIPFFCYLKLV